ncbi:MAG: UbiA family prenyltransferase [Verrucomicrobia bacterium]|nr:UbiA family prenyltransferase [Verrucomicrobiota bacterium]
MSATMTPSESSPSSAWDPHNETRAADDAEFSRLRALPWFKRLRLYLRQRFPLAQHGILIFSYFSANQFLAQTVTAGDGPMVYNATSWLNFFMLLCLFFHLRVFDEHKDREKDVAAYPDRLLSRGVFSYRDLWRLGLLAVALEALIAFVAGPAALLTWLLVLGWSLLMYREFFIGNWLCKHVFLYAVTHTTIMFGFDLLIWSVTTGRWFWQTDPIFIVYAFNGVFIAFTFEFARKLRPPEDEHDQVDSYSKTLGPRRAALLVFGVMAAATACTAWVGLQLKFHPGFHLLLLLLLALGSSGVVCFYRTPNRKNAKLVALTSSLHIISFDFCLVFFLIARHGLRVSLFTL